MIRFGTSGWRAVISDEFTFRNVRRVARAIASQVKETPGAAERGLAVGYDTRFLSEEFASEAARVVAAEGCRVELAVGPLPTPVLAFVIREDGFAGGINITASHNPPRYNGMKFSTADGAPASPDVTRSVEARLDSVDGAPLVGDVPSVRTFNPGEAYFARLGELLDESILKDSTLRVAVDSRFGTTRGWLDEYLQRCGVEVVRLHDRRDPLFGDGSPGCDGADLADLAAAVVEQDLDLGVATDGDGDRFGIIDAGGRPVSANSFLGLLVDYLGETRSWSGGVGRTVATTHLIDRVAERRGLAVHETPVGFKYFNALLADGSIFLAGEESAGLSVKGHVPEKDGVLAACLAVEMLAARKMPLARQLEVLHDTVGPVFNRREDRAFPVARRSEIEARLKQRPGAVAGVAVAHVQTTDGVKWVRADGSWVLVRVSGTEPVVRVYAEADSEDALEALLTFGLGVIP
ncbi:MAG: phosphoglucomutase/phosphomannomutase family protein [Acidobacteriota bacterium]